MPETPMAPTPVSLGTQATVQPVLGDGSTLLLEKAQSVDLRQTVTLPENLTAPVCKGDRLGTLTVLTGETVLAEIPLLAGEDIPRITYLQQLLRLLPQAFIAK